MLKPLTHNFPFLEYKIPVWFFTDRHGKISSYATDFDRVGVDIYDYQEYLKMVKAINQYIKDYNDGSQRNHI